jgi:hypothetical protein
MRPRTLVIIALVLCALAELASAQVITANVRGKIVSADDGVPMAEAQVSLLNLGTGATKTTTSNSDGEFVFAQLPIGGPYRVTAEAEGFKLAEMKGIFLSAGKTVEVKLELKLQEEVIEVKGAQVPRSVSNKQVVTAQQIEQLPSIGRDPKDLARLTPEAAVSGSSMTIAGQNNRFNSLTVDGIREDDDFGLNSSGYPTRRSPISLSAIQEMTIESAPFDVRYSKFMGGNLNIVTKSGTNDFHGELFTSYSSDALMGKHIGAQTVPPTAKFQEFRYGAELAGPVVQDVHFMASFEGLNAVSPVDAGPADSNAVNKTQKVTSDEMAMAQQIAQQVYGWNAGTPNRNLSETDLKVFAKAEWEISPQHRFVASYQRTGGASDTPANSSNQSNLSLSSDWYNEADTLNAFSARLYSDWSSQLSTQIIFDGKLVSARPTPLNGNGFMAAQIRTAEGGTILLGPDDFRQTNTLDNNILHGKAEANYLAGKHLFTGGLEYEQLFIDNLFIADTDGGVVYPSLMAFQMQQPSQITYSNATTLNPKDGAANWQQGILSMYAQDQLKLDELTVQGGLRLETYVTGNAIAYNQNFANRYAAEGLTNTATLNGRSILMPRVGASYLATPDLNLHTGGGLYSGGTPTVWVSNAYSNDGVRIATAVSNDPNVVNGFDGRNIPQGLKNMIQPGNGFVDVLDPNFKLPSQWKIGAGADYVLDGWTVKGNYMFSKVAEGVTWIDLRRDLATLTDNTPVGTSVDGRAIYDAGFNVHRGYDMLLTNTTQGYGHVLSLAVEKAFPFGLFVSGSYAFQHVLEINPANSSRSVSNFDNVGVVDPNNPSLAVSNYETEHRLTLALQYSKELVGYFVDEGPWKNMKTQIGMFAEARSGQPYSWTFTDSNFGKNLAAIFGEDQSIASHNQELFYVPQAGYNDVILNGITPDQMDAFLKQTGLDKYRGRIAPRNAFQSPWYKRIDMRFSQDLPNPFAGHRARVFFDIQNLGNLLDHKWGRLTSVGFPYNTPAVDLSLDPATGKYVYSNLRPPDPNLVDVLSSVWRMSIGLMYDF